MSNHNYWNWSMDPNYYHNYGSPYIAYPSNQVPHYHYHHDQAPLPTPPFYYYNSAPPPPEPPIDEYIPNLTFPCNSSDREVNSESNKMLHAWPGNQYQSYFSYPLQEQQQSSLFTSTNFSALAASEQNEDKSKSSQDQPSAITDQRQSNSTNSTLGELSSVLREAISTTSWNPDCPYTCTDTDHSMERVAEDVEYLRPTQVHMVPPESIDYAHEGSIGLTSITKLESKSLSQKKFPNHCSESAQSPIQVLNDKVQSAIYNPSDVLLPSPKPVQPQECDQVNQCITDKEAMEVIDKLTYFEKLEILYILFDEVEWEEELDHKLETLLQITCKVKLVKRRNRTKRVKLSKVYEKNRTTFMSRREFKLLQPYILGKIAAWKLQLKSSNDLFSSNHHLEGSNVKPRLSSMQKNWVIQQICIEIPNFDLSWNSEIAAKLSTSVEAITRIKKEVKQYGPKHLFSDDYIMPNHVIKISNKLIDNMTKTPVRGIIESGKNRKYSPITVFGELELPLMPLEKMRILKDVLKKSMPFDTSLCKEVSLYLGIHKSTVSKRYNHPEKFDQGDEIIPLSIKEEKISKHIQQVLLNKSNKEEDDSKVSPASTTITRKTTTRQQTSTRKEVSSANGVSTTEENSIASPTNILSQEHLSESLEAVSPSSSTAESSNDKISNSKFPEFTKLSGLYKSYLIQHLFNENPWPAECDSTIMEDLGYPSYKFNNLLSKLRSVKNNRKLTYFPVVHSMLETLQPYLTEILKKFKTNQQMSPQMSLKETLSPSSLSITSPPTSDIPLAHPVVKIEEKPPVDNKTRILKYIQVNVPNYHPSWNGAIYEKLGCTKETFYALKHSIVKDAEKIAQKFDETCMTEYDLEVAKELVESMKCSPIYTKQKTPNLYGMDSPLYDFGNLGTKLSRNQKQNVLALTFKKAFPFGSYWSKKIASYLQMNYHVVALFRRNAIRGNVKYKKEASYSKTEDQVSSHLARIIKSWRDARGNPYNENDEKNLPKLKSAIQEFFKKSQDFPDDATILNWSKQYQISDYKCYTTVKTIRQGINCAPTINKK